MSEALIAVRGRNLNQHIIAVRIVPAVVLTNKMAKFVHLHTHTEYSLLDGLSKIKALVKKTKELGMDSIAITDHGSMYGVIEFYKACLAEGLKPIIGCEMYVAKRSHKDREGKLDAEPFHLTVLARNYKGYLNLLKLVSISHLEGFYYRPRVDKELLTKYHEGLIALSGCPSGEFVRGLDESIEKAEKVARTYLEIFGEGNYYFEIQNHHYDKYLKDVQEELIRQELEQMGRLQKKTWDTCLKLSKKIGVPIVATKDLHYINKEDAQAHDAVLCVQTGKFVSDIQRLRMIDTPELYLKSAEEMIDDFKDIPEAITNTVSIAKKCNVEIPLNKVYFPVFKTPGGEPSIDYLRRITYEKAKQKVEMTDQVNERLEYELEVIVKKGLADYCLVFYDFLDWAHQQGIITNTRGSAAGSLVLYCLDITNQNPLDYQIPFERFLTIYRPTYPDIDADLADDRRDEVIRYLMQKYGEDKVVHIVTFGTMMGRAAIRDIGRVLAVPYGEVDKIAKLVPPPHQGFHKPLVEALKEVPELQDAYRSNQDYQKMIDLAIKVEGTVRHASVHAAGILIAPDDITNYVPLQREASGDKVVSQYDMFSAIEEYGGVGLVKMDLLGIRNLSILGRAVEYVKKNQNIDVNINQIPLDDKKTYELLTRGSTMGVFQLSSAGMTRYLMELKPNSITDLAAMVALYRPGPMGIIPEYIQRKNNPKLIKYYDPRMKEFMKQSLGLFVYQEDVLYTAINLAGYSWQEVDKFRKAMGKKKPEEMKKEKEHFIRGCSEKGMTKEKAEQLFDLIAAFAAYGFNKAHAASYAMVSYQTAYMKANYPVEFMAAVMTAEYGDTDKIVEAIEECKKMGIVVLPPGINSSGVGFTIEDLEKLSSEELERRLAGGESADVKQGIRFGLSAIKNVGLLAIESILKSRKEKEFLSMADLCSRVDTRLVNRKALESLIKAGALDSFGTRSSQLMVLDQCLDMAHKNAKAFLNGQESLFNESEDSSIKLDLPDVDELPLDQLLIFEKDLLGFYLHEPPYLDRIKQLDQFVSFKISSCSQEHIGKKVILGGVILEVKKVITKKSSQEMAFIRIFDGTAEIEGVVFPRLFSEKKDLLVKEDVILVEGRLDLREDQYSIVVDSIDLFDPQSSNPVTNTSLIIQIPQGADGDLLKKVNLTLRKFPGQSPISLLIPSGDSLKKMSLAYGVSPQKQLLQEITQLLGENSIKVNSF